MELQWKAADSHFSNGRIFVGGFCAVKKDSLGIFTGLRRLCFAEAVVQLQVSVKVQRNLSVGLGWMKAIWSHILLNIQIVEETAQQIPLGQIQHNLVTYGSLRQVYQSYVRLNSS